MIQAPGNEIPRRRVEKDEPVLIRFRIPKRKLKQANQLAQWYRDVLKVKVSLAYLLRESFNDFIDRETRIARKAERGRFHAKVRNHNT